MRHPIIMLHYEAWCRVERKRRALERAEEEQSKLIQRFPLTAEEIAEYAKLTEVKS